MSRSIHIRIKNFKGLTKAELSEQVTNPDSNLELWSKKSIIKKEIKVKRKNSKLNSNN